MDTNILVYAHRRDSSWHDRAARCIRSLAEGRLPWLIPWPYVHEFLAIVTHPRVYKPPSTVEEALQQVDAWLESPSLIVTGEGADHWKVLRATVLSTRTIGPMMHDARVAVMCIERRVDALWTADRDFSRFSPLQIHNPLMNPDTNV